MAAAITPRIPASAMRARIERFRIEYVLAVAYLATLSAAFLIVRSQYRGYQDSWILEDIAAPVFAVAAAYAVFVVATKSPTIVALASTSWVFFLNAIPSLKYEIFYGTSDAINTHFPPIRQIAETGFLVQDHPYSGVPALHLLVNALASIPGIPLLTAAKFAPALLASLVPLVMYVVGSQLIADRRLRKFVVIAASLPLVPGYVLWGTSNAAPLFLAALLFAYMYAASQKNSLASNPRAILIILVLVSALALAHTASTGFALILSFTSIVFLKLTIALGYDLPKETSRRLIRIWLYSAAIYVMWLAFMSNSQLTVLVTALSEVITVGHYRNPTFTGDFAGLPILTQVRAATVLTMHAQIILTAALAGFVLALLRLRKLDPDLRQFALWVVAAMVPSALIVGLLIVTPLGGVPWQRMLAYVMFLTPLPVGILLWRCYVFLGENLRAVVGVGTTTAVIIVGALFGFFPYQPLMPRSTDVVAARSEEEYFIDVREVNTVSSKIMVKFVNDHANTGPIAADRWTRQQWKAFGDYEVLQKLEVFHANPISADQTLGRPWRLGLLHTKKGGPFAERLWRLPPNGLGTMRAARSPVYDNGEAFVLLERTGGAP